MNDPAQDMTQRLRDAVESRDQNIVLELIREDPLGARSAITELSSMTKDHIGRLKEERQELLSASYGNLITRSQFHREQGKLGSELRRAEGFVRVLNQYVQMCQQEQGRIRDDKRTTHRSLIDAIETHYRASRDGDFEPEAHDIELWKHVGMGQPKPDDN